MKVQEFKKEYIENRTAWLKGTSESELVNKLAELEFDVLLKEIFNEQFDTDFEIHCIDDDAVKVFTVTCDDCSRKED